MVTRYQFDPTGRSPNNLVENERHTLDDNFDSHLARMIYTRYGGFFNDSLIVKQEDTVLTLNEDYCFTFFWQDATKKVGAPISRAIEIINDKLVGDITLTYQVLGGIYQDRLDTLKDTLVQLPKYTRNVYWDEVLEIPEAYFPERHIHHINDVFGLARLVAVVDDLRRSLERQSVLKLKTVYDRFLKLKQWVESNLDDIDEYKKQLAVILQTIDDKLTGFITADDVNRIVEESIRTEKQLLEQRIDGVSNRLNEETERLSTAVTSVDDRVNVLTNKTNQDKEELEGKLAKLQTKLDEANTVSEDKYNELKGYIDEKDGELTNQITTLESSLSNKIAESNAEVKQYINDNLAETKRELKDYTDTAKTNLQGNIDQLSREVNQKHQTQQDEIDALKQQTDTNNNALARQVEDLENRVNTNAETLGEHQSKIDALENKTTTLEGNVNDIRLKGEEQDNTLANLGNRLDATDRRINEVNDTLGNRLNDLSDNLNTVSDNLNKTKERINDINNELTRKIDNDISALNDRLDGVDNKITSNEVIERIRSDVDALKTFKTEANENLNNLKQTVNTVNETLLDHRNKIDTLIGQNNPAKIAELNQALNDYKQKTDESLSTINTTLDDVKQSLSQINEKDLEQDNRLTVLETAKQTLEGNIQRVGNDLNRINRELSDNINTLTERVSNVENRLTQVEEKNRTQDGLIAEAKNIANEAKQKADTTSNKVDDNLSSINRLKENITTLNESLNTLTDKDTEQDRAIQSLTEKNTVLENETRDLKDNVTNTYLPKETYEEDKELLLERIDAFASSISSHDNAITRNTEDINNLKRDYEASNNRPQGDQFNEEELARLVKKAMDKNIADSRAINDSLLEMPNLPILPEEEGGVTFVDGTDMSVYPITYMDTSLETDDYSRSVFAPNTIYEFTRNTTWTIPDHYNLLLAQVFVTNAIRGYNTPTGKVVFRPPSTRVGYVLLKGGVNVPITVGEISSFGSWLTNDGTNGKGVIHPSYPIVIDPTQTTNDSDDIRQLFGKQGKVTIVV